MRSMGRHATLCVLAALAVLGAPAATQAETLDPAIDTLTNILKEGSDAAGSGAVCATQEGPFHCTGRFGGAYDLSCRTTTKGTGTTEVKDYGGGTLSFLGDGSIELRLESKSPVWGREKWTGPGSESHPIRGRVDSSGHILIEKKEADTTLRWEGQFNLSPTAGGQQPTGTGKYDSKGIYLDGDVVQTCQGTFKLGGPAAIQRP